MGPVSVSSGEGATSECDVTKIIEYRAKHAEEFDMSRVL